MNIKNPLNIHAIFYNEKLQLRWNDILGEFSFSLWVDKDTLRPTSLYGEGCACLYKDPGEGKPFFHTRTLKPEAKVNAIVVQHVAKFARDHGLSIKAQNEHYQTVERNREADNQTTIRERKEAVADELYAALLALLPLAEASGDYVDPGYQWAIEAVVGARRAIEAAQGPVVTLTQNGPAGQYDAYSVDYKGQGGNCHRGLPEAREQAAKLAKKHDAIVVETLKDWRSA